MKAVLLANMGAPTSEKEMKIFLSRMFRDKAILNVPLPVRMLLSSFISNSRYKSSWKKYQQIGGSPLHSSMNKMRVGLENLFSDEYLIRCVYSYSSPLIHDEIQALYYNGIENFIIIPMYPQASFSTTGSLETEIKQLKMKLGNIKIRLVDDYFENQHFITFWAEQIRAKLTEIGYSNPYLLFSAHAIPQSFIDRGDAYADKIQTSARLIAAKLNLPYSVSFQSKIGKMEWTEPYTIEHLKELHNNKIDQIVMIPISFINENLETKYDLDHVIIPCSEKKTGIKNICRLSIPESDDRLIKMFYEFIIQSDENN